MTAIKNLLLLLFSINCKDLTFNNCLHFIVKLLAGDTYLHQFSLLPFDYGLYAKMDAAACRALHLNLNSLEQHSRNEVTLISVIDKCRTAQVLFSIIEIQ